MIKLDANLTQRIFVNYRKLEDLTSKEEKQKFNLLGSKLFNKAQKNANYNKGFINLTILKLNF